MIKFDLLEQALIFNSTTVTGSQYLFNQEEINSLIDLNPSSILISNQEIGLEIDLKTQTSLHQIQYKVNPLLLSNVEIEYGRTLDNMFSATPVVSGSFITVNPTESGYTSPRFIRIKDSFVGSSGFVEQLNILNTDEEIVFGSGNLNSITLVGDIVESTSEVVEIPITNSGTITADVYVALDPSATPINFSNFEISLTPTGTFYKFNEDLTIPDRIPWRLGYLNNLLISENDELKFNNPIQSDNLNVGSVIELPPASFVDEVRDANLVEIIDIDGNRKVARSSTDYSIQIIDPLFATRKKSALPSIHPAPVDTYESENTKIAWDNGDYLYYLTGKADQSIYRYSLSQNIFELFTTVTGFYNRRLRAVEIYQNELYILGGLSSASSSKSIGNQLWKVNLTTQVETQLTSFPGTLSSFRNFTAQQDNYIYIAIDISSNNFFRYNITLDFWETLTNAPLGTFNDMIGLSSDALNNRVVYFTNEFDVTAYAFNTFSNSFSQITTIENAYPSIYWTPDLGAVALEGSLIVAEALGFSVFRNFAVSKVLGQFPSVPLGATSGTWISPVIEVLQDDSSLTYEPYLNYNKQQTIEINSVANLGIETFEIRGSNNTPSAENSLQLFDTSLDPTEFFILNLDGSTATTSGNSLILSHIPGGDPVNTSVVTFGFPINTLGKMQYSFYYSPATNRQAGSTHYSRFYIAPFLDSLGVGDAPERDSETLARTANNYIYLEFGNLGDSGGVITGIKFYNGSLTNSAGVNLTSGQVYRLDLLVDYEQGTYELLLDTVLILNGTIPFTQINKFFPQHTYEFFSAADGVAANEKYKSFYITRVGNVAEQDSNFTSFNIKDLTYGVNGLDYNVVTLNNPIIPKTKYIQLKLVLRSGGGGEDLSVINSIQFPRVLVLEKMTSGETRSVYVRYTFPETDQSGTSTIYLKTWMRTDN